MRGRVGTLVFFGALLAAFAPALYRAYTDTLTWELVAPAPVRTADAEPPVYRAGFVPGVAAAPAVHSASLVELGNGDLLAVWYGGSREGAADVALYQSTWDTANRAWTPARRIADPRQTRDDLTRYVRKLGNPALLRFPDGRIGLFYVSVSVGGWAGSAINYRVSEDNGASWGNTHRLVTSPFLNIGTLVRAAPVAYADGGIGLPVYHELLGKFGELLRLDADGRVRDKRRITWGRSSLQPSAVALDADRVVAFLRYSGAPPARVLRVESGDGGRNWSAPEKLVLPNPNAAVAALRALDGTLWLVFNNSEEDRNNLVLAHSADTGRSWKIVQVFEDENAPAAGPVPEFSYPALIQARDGTFHLVYTWNRKRIMHVMFNQAWLRGASL